jgi:hypothetical protein
MSRTYSFVLTSMKRIGDDDVLYMGLPGLDFASVFSEPHNISCYISPTKHTRIGDVITFRTDRLEDIITDISKKISVIHPPEDSIVEQAIRKGDSVTMPSARNNHNLFGPSYRLSKDNITDVVASHFLYDDIPLHCLTLIRNANIDALKDSTEQIIGEVVNVIPPHRDPHHYLVVVEVPKKYKLTGDEYHIMYHPFMTPSTVAPDYHSFYDGSVVTFQSVQQSIKGLDHMQAFLLMEAHQMNKVRRIAVLEKGKTTVLSKNSDVDDVRKALGLYAEKSHLLYGKHHPLVLVQNYGAGGWPLPEYLGFKSIYLQPGGN